MIDIKTLRVGSHINLCDKRQRIMAIDAQNGLIGVDAYKTDENGVKHPLGYKVEDIEPISITPEILKELGFEEDKTDIAKRVGGYYIYFHQINNLRWRVSLEEENCTNYGNCIVRYLHEAEAFLALHGVELIKE